MMVVLVGFIGYLWDYHLNESSAVGRLSWKTYSGPFHSAKHTGIQNEFLSCSVFVILFWYLF